MASRRHAAPTPPARKSPKLIALGAGAIWRVHAANYRAAQFNPGQGGDARFSPIKRADGTAIPTLYGASSLAGAMMETVFHDVPTPPAGYILDLERLRDETLVVSRIRLKRRVQVVDLSTKGLERLGLRRIDLIDTPVTAYLRTRSWAEWFHGATTAKGLQWTSKQDDGAKAVMLFGDRLPEPAFQIEIDREPLCDGEHLDALLDLAGHIGIERLFDP